MTPHGKAFDVNKEEIILNKMFSQILDPFEGGRTAAATALRERLLAYRKDEPDVQLRIIMGGSSAERTLGVIDRLQKAALDKDAQIKAMAAHIGVDGMRAVERRLRQSKNDHRDELMRVILGHLYGGRHSKVPRGAAKALAPIFGCSEKVTRAILLGQRSATAQQVDRVREAVPFPPVPSQTSRHSKSQAVPTQLDLPNADGELNRHATAYHCAEADVK